MELWSQYTYMCGTPAVNFLCLFVLVVSTSVAFPHRSPCTWTCTMREVSSPALALIDVCPFPAVSCFVFAQVPIPMHMDLYHLKEEAEPSDRTALEAVVDHIKEEMARLNAEEERIMVSLGASV